MHVERIQTSLPCLLLLAQFIVDTHLGWFGYMRAKKVAQMNKGTPQHEGMRLLKRYTIPPLRETRSFTGKVKGGVPVDGPRGAAWLGVGKRQAIGIKVPLHVLYS